MNTNELIEAMVQEARPVQPLWGPGRLALAFAAVVAFVALAVASFQPRPDLMQEVQRSPLWMESGLLLIAALGIAIAAAALARPASRNMRLVLIAAVVASAGALLVMGLRDAKALQASWLLWTGLVAFCGSGSVLFSLVPFAFGIWLLRRGASVHPVRSGILIGLGAAALGGIAEMWSCDINDAAHVICGHAILPAIFLAGLGAWAGRRWLRW